MLFILIKLAQLIILSQQQYRRSFLLKQPIKALFLISTIMICLGKERQTNLVVCREIICRTPIITVLHFGVGLYYIHQ